MRTPFDQTNRLVARFEDLGLLREITGQRRGRLYRYDPYLDLFDEPAPPADQAVPLEVTETPREAGG